MKRHEKFMAVMVIIIPIILLWVFVNQMGTKAQTEPALVGKEATVTWQTLNLREAAGTSSEVIEELTRGEQITLTGRCRETSIEEPSLWVEVETQDGVSGWLYRQGITFR